MNNWFSQHMQTLELVLRRFKTYKLSTLLICLAIGVTLALQAYYTQCLIVQMASPIT